MFLIQLSELTSLSCHFQGFRLEAKTSHCNRYLLSRDSLSFTARLQYLIIPQRAVEGKSVSRGTVKSLADALFGAVWLVGSGHSIVPGSTGCCVKWFVMTVSVFMFHHTHTTTPIYPSEFTQTQVFGLQAVVSRCKTGHGKLVCCWFELVYMLESAQLRWTTGVSWFWGGFVLLVRQETNTYFIMINKCIW